MKELNPLLKSFLFIIGGDIAIEVGRELLNSKGEEITDEDIAENIKERIKGKKDFEPEDEEILKVNTVRKTLYVLYSEKLAQFRRIRDKSTGWFIYFWWEDFDLIEELLFEKKRILQEKLRDRLEYEKENQFFSCKECEEGNINYTFEEAFELNFRCPECGNPLEVQENQDIISFLKTKIIQNRQITFSTED
ncbi:MAG: transcription factor [Promethearchaeota archaeon]|nr:MAG: transcription factor [Candidatus Lokiarchaeota archaeon]